MEKLAVLRYAKALFDLAVEKQAVEEYNNAAKTILAAFNNDGEILSIINHPGVPVAKKLEALELAFKDQVPDDFMGLFALLLGRGRKNEIVGVLEHFDTLYLEFSKKAVAKLISYEDLPPEKIREIVDILSKKLDKTILVEKIIDKSLIAGFRVEVDGFVFDASIKNQMTALKKELLGQT